MGNEERALTVTMADKQGKDYKCGNKGCWVVYTIMSHVILVIGIVLFLLLISGTPRKNNHSDTCSGINCDRCYDDSSGQYWLEQCCDSARSCDEAHGLFWWGLLTTITGLVMSALGCCGICKCCCFGA